MIGIITPIFNRSWWPKGSVMGTTVKLPTKCFQNFKIFFKIHCRIHRKAPNVHIRISFQSIQMHTVQNCASFLFSKFKSRWQNKVIFMASDTPTRNRLIYNVYIYLYLAVLNLIFRTICFIMLMVVPIMFSLKIYYVRNHTNQMLKLITWSYMPLQWHHSSWFQNQNLRDSEINQI